MTLLENLKILNKDTRGLCSQELYYKTKKQFDLHDIGNKHHKENCEICRLAQQVY